MGSGGTHVKGLGSGVYSPLNPGSCNRKLRQDAYCRAQSLKLKPERQMLHAKSQTPAR